MTDDDSGSSGDSPSDSGSPDSGSSDSGASSDASAGWGGVDLSPVVQNLVDELLDARQARAGAPPEPGAAERRRRAQFEAALRSIALAPAPPDRRSLVRRVVETDRWFVPTTPSGAFERATGADELVWQAFTRPLVPGQPERQAGPEGRPPARLLLVLAIDPGRPARQLTGLELARAIPADVDGVLCLLAEGGAVGLRRDELPLLAQLTDAFDLEDVLVNPAPGQCETLQTGRWYVPATNEALRPEPFSSYLLTFVYTHPDRAEASDGPMIELDGRTLFSRLASRDDYDGITVNLESQTGRGDAEVQVLLLGPNVASEIVRGVDPRPGAAPLPARTLAEVQLWLDLEEFPGLPFVTREIVEVERPADGPGTDGPGTDLPAAGAPVPDGTTFVQVRADVASTWRIVETSYAQLKRPGPVWSPVFAVADPAAAPGDLGAGPTRILCSGKLARHLYRHNTYQPPRWLIRRKDRQQAARLWRLAHELEKLLPPGADRLPRATIRTAHGAQFLRDRSTFRTRAWIQEQLQRYERAAFRRFVF